jgi:hypothetical protein
MVNILSQKAIFAAKQGKYLEFRRSKVRQRLGEGRSAKRYVRLRT